MVEKGYAWTYTGKKDKNFEELELKRKSNGTKVENTRKTGIKIEKDER